MRDWDEILAGDEGTALEMLPVVDKPVVQYLVEEAVASGIEEIIFLTGRGKRAIEDHFDVSYELEDTLVEKNKLDLLEAVQKISGWRNFRMCGNLSLWGWMRSFRRRIWLMMTRVSWLFSAIVFMTVLYRRRANSLKHMPYKTPIILADIPREEVSKFGVVAGDRVTDVDIRVREIVEKPSVEAAPIRSLRQENTF